MCWKFNKYIFHKSDPLWLRIAFDEIGVKEIIGKKHNSRILEYHQTCDLKANDDETSWCSAFVNWCLTKSDIKGTDKANARSWMNWGSEDVSRRGSVCVLWRENINSWKGHVGFLINKTGKYVYLLGGNQNNKVSIEKYPIARVLGYRWVKEESMEYDKI